MSITERSLASAAPIRPWFEEQPERYNWELQELRRSGLEPVVDEALKAAGALVLTVRVAIRDEEIALRVHYPPGFPQAAPQIAAPEVALSSHQTPWLTALCVLAAQRAWTANHSAAQLLSEAQALLEASIHDRERLRRDESPAPEPATFYLLHHPNAGAVIPSAMQVIDWFRTGWGTFDAQRLGSNLLLIDRVSRASSGAVPLRAPDTLRSLAKAGGDDAVHGAWFWFDEHPPYPLPGGTYDDAVRSQYVGLVKELESRFPDAIARARSQGRRQESWLAVVFPDESGKRNQFIAGWLVVRITREKQGERFRFYRPLYWPSEDHLTGLSSLDALRGKRVGLIGAGAIGSSVALELAKAGVGQLTIVDSDFVSPMNLVRHEAGFFELGLSKAAAVARRIGQQAPWTSVVTRGTRLGAGDLLNPAQGWLDHQRLVEELGTVDLLIDATADPQTTALLNQLALRNRTTLLIGWATGGAWGGRLIRVRPFATACYECVGWWASSNEAIEPPHDPTAYRYPEGCAHPSFGGAGFETKAIALALTRLAISTLARDTGYPDFASDHYVLALRDERNQRERLWIPLSTPRADQCASCGSATVEIQEPAREKQPSLNT